jgi:beta-fructofuranosidase
MICIKRRAFITGIMRTAALTAISQGQLAAPLMAEAPSSTMATDPRRPQYHFLPASNWMNDPNGPIHFNGNYHLFYQFNPNGAVWGDMHWGHAISFDMVNWRHLPVALAPTPSGPDADGCFTGTAVIKDGQVVVLYTGVHAVAAEQATSMDGAHIFRETQCLATSSDPELQTWSKLPAPVIPAPPPGMQVNGFRDPSPWCQGDWWHVVIGSGIADKGGAVLLYKSRDLRSWEFVHILARRNQNRVASFDPFDPWEVWECPEFFALGAKHVLIFSTGGKAYWQSGELDAEKMIFHSEQAGMLDYGSFYAPKTQLDKSGNRIMWGWIPETRPVEECKAAGWAGLMSLPRVLSLGKDGRLRIRVAAEVNTLRGHEQILNIVADEDRNRRQIEAMRIEGASAEIRLTARRTQEPFELALQSADDAVTWLILKYDPLQPRQILIDGRPLPVLLGENEDLELHLYVDGSVIEVFVNQHAACTKRFYPLGSKSRDMSLQLTGKTANLVSLSVWQMSPISSNRLTT